MHIRTNRKPLAAALVVGCGALAGCTGQIGTEPQPGPGPGNTPPVGAEAPGGGTYVDSDNDGVADGIDLDGDGVPDQVIEPETDPVANPVPGNPAVCTPGVPGTTQLPRLTQTQYDNTIRDLTGITTLTSTGLPPSSSLAPDRVGSVDQQAWDLYQKTAEVLATQIMADPAARAKVIPCTPDGAGDACAQQLIDSFGLKAFRRPLTTEESARFGALWTNRATITATGSFDEAAELIIRAFLLSPSFLTKGEFAKEEANGASYALNDYEVATRLSYLIWGSMPDDALFAAAAAGNLSTPDQIRIEAERMLADPKARGMVADFHKLYAHMGPSTRWAEYNRDTSLYPAFDPAMIPVMAQETERLFDYIVFDQQGTFQDLLTSPVAFVNASTAPLYGLDASQYGADLTLVTLDGNARPGIFTRVGFLGSHASFNRTSPILRGAFLQKEVLCAEIGTPPPGAEGTELPTEGLATNRERVDAQTAAAACANCHHVYINPTGFALEGFDAIGAVQTMDNGVQIDTAATVPLGNNADGSLRTANVTGALDLMQSIASSPEAQRCYAEKWVQYAYQREANSMDACTVNQLTTKLTQGGYTVLNLITDLTQSEQFRYRAIKTETSL